MRCLYVGSSKNVKKRIGHHLSALSHGRHYNTVLTHLWNKYGRGDLIFMLLEECPVEQLLEREDHWMFAMPEWPKANLQIGATRPVLSQETRETISAANKGKVMSVETRARMSATRKGRNGWAWSCAHRSANAAYQRKLRFEKQRHLIFQNDRPVTLRRQLAFNF